MEPMSRRSVVAMLVALVALGIVVIAISGPGDGAGDVATTTTTTANTPTTTTIAKTPTTTTIAKTPTTTTTTLPPDVVAVEALLQDMDDREVALQLVVLGAAGADPAVSIAETLGAPCIGGLFVTKNLANWTPAESLDAATAAITEIATVTAGCDAPPFITTDAEPGTRVLKVPIEPLPGPATLEAGFGDDPRGSALRREAEAFADQLASAGVHVNLGVIVDVDVDNGFYMDRQGRSFGDDPFVVDGLGRAIADGHCRAGVAPTLKHFPNQGSTVEDPHREDSFSVNGFDTWLEVGAVPYLESTSPLVMTGHIRYDGVDGGLPASLSREITTGWLRSVLGYDGVVITDDLHTMRGVAQFAPAARGVAAIAAGADLALYVDVEHGVDVVDAITDRMAADADFNEQARASAARVLRLKGALGLLSDIDPDWFELCG